MGKYGESIGIWNLKVGGANLDLKPKKGDNLLDIIPYTITVDNNPEFGKGTVGLITAINHKKYGDLILKTCKKKPLNYERTLTKKEMTDVKFLAPEIVFRFYKTESIDIVIENLNNLKAAILKGEF